MLRIPLSFKADYYLSYSQGFLCFNLSGNIALLDIDGNYLGETNLDVSITSLSPLGDDKIMMIVDMEKGQEKRIYQIC